MDIERGGGSWVSQEYVYVDQGINLKNIKFLLRSSVSLYFVTLFEFVYQIKDMKMLKIL